MQFISVLKKQEMLEKLVLRQTTNKYRTHKDLQYRLNTYIYIYAATITTTTITTSTIFY